VPNLNALILPRFAFLFSASFERWVNNRQLLTHNKINHTALRFWKNR